MTLRILVVMDPPETVLVDADTSFALMEEAQSRGHRVEHCLITDLFAEADPKTSARRAGARVRQASMSRDPSRAPITLGATERVWLDQIDVVLIRKDPPFDANYLWATQILELARGKTLLVNDPRALRDANEKLYALHFTDVMPRTAVTQHAAHIRAFVDAVGGRAVLKPLDGAGGRGVMVLDRADLNFNAIIEATTEDGKKLAMVQEFLPAVRQGDKRVLLLDGEPLGAILRVPRADEARSNIHVGGTVERTELTEAELAIVRRVGPRLRADGLYFVGLDVIGERLTEVNVTSPTGIQELSRFAGDDPEGKVIAWIERRVREAKRTG